MKRRWNLQDDQFLTEHHEVGADFVASHDLGFHGKGAGTKRLEKLKETGVFDKMVAYREARIEMQIAWSLAFGPAWAKEIAESEQAQRNALPATHPHSGILQPDTDEVPPASSQEPADPPMLAGSNSVSKGGE